MKNDKKALDRIKQIGIEIDHNKAFGGKSRGNRHLLRVVRISRFLAIEMNADLFVTTAGAYLHDTALPSGNDYDYSKNKKIVMKLLKSIDISDDEKIKIAECVASHEGTVRPKTLEAKIVHDADVLEKTGFLGLIRHTWKTTNSGKMDPQNIRDRDIEKILSHLQWRAKRLQTPLAKKMAKYLIMPLIDKETAKLIVPIISAMAYDGIITEKIVKSSKQFLSKDQYKRLDEQIHLRYLGRA